MAAKPVRFHEQAGAEYEDALDWYLARSPQAAAEFSEELTRAVELIAGAPHRWARDRAGTRRFLLHRFPFARGLPGSLLLSLAFSRQFELVNPDKITGTARRVAREQISESTYI